MTTHAELVARAERWLSNTKKCGVVITERRGGSESPDAIGWRCGWWSTLVECKVSRADFLADRKKPHRLNPEGGMGQDRYYLTPAFLLKPEELPEGWGLLEVRGQVVRVIREAAKKPLSYERASHEVPLLVSEVWRLKNGVDSRAERLTGQSPAVVEATP